MTILPDSSWAAESCGRGRAWALDAWAPPNSGCGLSGSAPLVGGRPSRQATGLTCDCKADDGPKGVGRNSVDSGRTTTPDPIRTDRTGDVVTASACVGCGSV